MVEGDRIADAQMTLLDGRLAFETLAGAGLRVLHLRHRALHLEVGSLLGRGV